MRDEVKWWSDVILLALTVWREASNQPRGTKDAIAFSVLNRVARPSWWGTNLLSVLFKKWQYSSLTAPGDPNLVRWPMETDPSWWDSIEAAIDALENRVSNPFPGADSYFDASLVAAGKIPTWATADKYCGRSGAMMFYNIDQDHEAAAVAAAAQAQG